MYLPSLSDAEKRLAHFLLDFPGELAAYDAQELAKLSEVSKATVSRFVRRIGFENYDQARKAVRLETRAGSRLFMGHVSVPEDVSSVDQMLEEERANLEWTFLRARPEELQKLAEAVLNARKVWVVGQRISHSFASYLGWQLTKIVKDVVVCPQGGETMGEYISGMEEGDVVVYIALRRRMAGTEVLLDAISNIGAKLAVVSDEGMDVYAPARWHFLCRTQSTSPQFNHAAVLALCHQIVTRCTLAAGMDGRRRLREVDELNEALGSYET